MSALLRHAPSRRWLVAAGVALACILVLLAYVHGALAAYLVAWLFALSVCVGALVLRMVHVLTGGRWGEAIRPALVALTSAVPVAALLVAPLLYGLHDLFSWARPEAVAASELLQDKAGYLNVPFFLVRTVAALGIWSLLAWRMVTLDGPPDGSDPVRLARLRATSIAGLILYTLSVTWFSVDWVMSLVPAWKSTGFGLVFAVGQALSGFAAGLAVTAWTSRDPPSRARADVFNDLGNIMLMLVMTWMYLAFMQYLIAWIGDQPASVAWYLPRAEARWAALGALIVAIHFAAPSFLLLFRRVKRSVLASGALAAVIVVAHWLDVLWLVAPAFRDEGFPVQWIDLAFAAAMLAVLRAWTTVVAVRREPREERNAPLRARDHG